MSWTSWSLSRVGVRLAVEQGSHLALIAAKPVFHGFLGTRTAAARIGQRRVEAEDGIDFGRLERGHGRIELRLDGLEKPLDDVLDPLVQRRIVLESQIAIGNQVGDACQETGTRTSTEMAPTENSLIVVESVTGPFGPSRCMSSVRRMSER